MPRFHLVNLISYGVGSPECLTFHPGDSCGITIERKFERFYIMLYFIIYLCKVEVKSLLISKICFIKPLLTGLFSSLFLNVFPTFQVDVVIREPDCCLYVYCAKL